MNDRLLTRDDLELSPAADIPAQGMAVAAVPILVVTCLSLYLKLGNVQTLLVAACRCVVQLLLLGLILYPVFRNNQVYTVLAYIFCMILFATRESSLKPKVRYVGMRRHMFVSIILSLSVWLTVISFGVLRPSPPHDAQVMIPVAGMMLGSCVNALSLGVDRFLTSLRGESGNGSARLQTYLACGASKWEMAIPSIRQGIETGLTPNLNQMSVMGLVSIPGMFTGQVISGTSPFVAAKYQIVIMFFIFSNSTLTLFSVLLQATFFQLFEGGTLQCDLISKRTGGKPKDWVMALVSKLIDLLQWAHSKLRRKRSRETDASQEKEEDVECLAEPDSDRRPFGLPGTFRQTPSDIRLSDAGLTRQSQEVCLMRLSGGSISRGRRQTLPLLSNVNLALGHREILLISGESGCGKSSLLRALALLEPLNEGVLLLHDAKSDSFPPTYWRCEVLYVRQSGGQGLPGTPKELLCSLLAFQSQQQRRFFREPNWNIMEQKAELVQNIEKLDLPADIIEHRWDRLSGGETQRVYLCVMLALRPTVLLLDEPTSACDEQAARKVEGLIIRSGIAVLWVSHDPMQMQRLEQFEQTSCLCYQTMSASESGIPVETLPTKM